MGTAFWLRGSSTALLLALSVLSAVKAADRSEPTFSPGSVWHPPDEVAHAIAAKCSTESAARHPRCTLAEMRAAGASAAAVKATEALGGDSYVVEFRESGRVDVATVSAFLYNSPELARQEILVNGTPDVVKPLDHVADVDIRRDPAYSAIATRFPRATLWTLYTLKASEGVADGGQRFVFEFVLLDGCKACGIAGHARVAFDFDGSGRYVGAKLLGLRPS